MTRLVGFVLTKLTPRKIRKRPATEFWIEPSEWSSRCAFPSPARLHPQTVSIHPQATGTQSQTIRILIPFSPPFSCSGFCSGWTVIQPIFPRRYQAEWKAWFTPNLLIPFNVFEANPITPHNRCGVIPCIAAPILSPLKVFQVPKFVKMEITRHFGRREAESPSVTCKGGNC